MSEEDYQRGLRGGPCRVSTSDWERWSDWKAGNREYERQQELSALQYETDLSTLQRDVAYTLDLAVHKCPHCRQISLRTGVSHCPRCQVEVHSAYWASVAAARIKACQSAVATVKFGIDHSELLWQDAFHEAKRRHEAQPQFIRWIGRHKSPAIKRYYRFQITTSSALRGRWTIQPILILGIRSLDTGESIGFKHYRFASPHEYVAVFQYLLTQEAWNTPEVVKAIDGFQRWCDQDWPVAIDDVPEPQPEQTDYAASLQKHRNSATQGIAASQYELGRMHANGQGVPQDFTEALRWYHKAAEQGHAGAQRNIGVMYALAQAVSQDFTEALRWYRKAAEQGDARAQRNIGLMYARGQAVAQDYGVAQRWCRIAADRGDEAAQLDLGWMYYRGQGVPQNLPEALKWYRTAAEGGSAKGQFYADLITGKFAE